MHELSIAVALVEEAQQLARREHAAKVSAVSVRIGVLAGVEREALAFAFPLASEGTLLDGAGLSIEPEPLRVRCAACGAANDAMELCFQCPGCGSSDVNVSGGRDICITSLELHDYV